MNHPRVRVAFAYGVSRSCVPCHSNRLQGIVPVTAANAALVGDEEAVGCGSEELKVVW